MATTGFWLRGAKGKLAGAALQKGNDGNTIIREVVTPNNPQTEAQMIQRIMMKTVGAAYSAMKEITDHSFEGFKKGQATMSEFTSFNLKTLRDKVAAHVGDDLYELNSFTPLGSRVFVINEYQIARGSLPEIKTEVTGEDESSPGGLMALSANSYQAVINDYGLQRGDQLTFVVITANANNRGHQFHFARVILDPTGSDGEKLPLSTAFCGSGKVTSPSWRNEGEFTGLSYTDGKLKFQLGVASRTAAVGIIVSRKGSDDQWRRSDCTLTILSQSNGWSLGECLDKTQQASFSAKSSAYLNNAGTSAYVNGNGNSSGTSSSSSSGTSGGNASGPSAEG